MKAILLFISIIISCTLFPQQNNFSSEDISITEWVDGTLLIPNNVEEPPLAIIIAGSGPTNRDGNQNFLKNDALKKLAEQLTEKGIATFRYDKRIVKQIKLNEVDNKILFDDFVVDAKAVINYFKAKNSFSTITLVGHSQGSLVGLLVANAGVNKMVSLAGAGRNIGDVIVDQVTNTAPMLSEDTKRIVDTLRAGKTTKNYPPLLASMFNESLQPFMISWMAHSPTVIIKDLDIPILIVNGTKDIQVSVEEAKLLKSANDNADLLVIENMNHVLFIIEGDSLENTKSYNEVHRPISSVLVEGISKFISSK